MLFLVKFFFFLSLPVLLVFFLIMRRVKALQKANKSKEQIKVAFFYPDPFPSSQREKVLWFSIQSVLSSHNSEDTHLQVTLYSREKLDSLTVNRVLLEAYNLKLNFPRNTHLDFQQIDINSINRPNSLFSRYLAIFSHLKFALTAVTSEYFDVFFDSYTIPFGYRAVKYLTGAKIQSITYNPAVKQSEPSTKTFNEFLLSLPGRTILLPIQRIYAYSLSCADSVFVNSIELQQYLSQITTPNKCNLLYPPCNLAKVDTFVPNRPNSVVYLSALSGESEIELLKRFLSVCAEEMPDCKFDILTSPSSLSQNTALRAMHTALNEVKKSLDLSIHTHLDEEETLKLLEQTKFGFYVGGSFPVGLIQMISAGVIVLALNAEKYKKDLNAEKNSLTPIYLKDENEIPTVLKQTLSAYLGLSHGMQASIRTVNKFSEETFVFKLGNLAKITP